MPALQIVLGKRLVIDDLPAQVGRQRGAQPAAHLIAEGELFGRVVEIHRWWHQDAASALLAGTRWRMLTWNAESGHDRAPQGKPS